MRLRQGMTTEGLSHDAIRRALSMMHLFKRFCDSTGVDLILPTATSAGRDAAKGPAFVDQLLDELGLQLARPRRRAGSLLRCHRSAQRGRSARGYVLDISGSSAQVSEVRDRRYARGESGTLGALALTERYVHQDPPSHREVEALRAEIDAQLSTIPCIAQNCGGPLIGLGGTIRNLAKIEIACHECPFNTLHGFVLTTGPVEASVQLFREITLAKRGRSPASAVAAATSSWLAR